MKVTPYTDVITVCFTCARGARPHDGGRTQVRALSCHSPAAARHAPTRLQLAALSARPPVRPPRGSPAPRTNAAGGRREGARASLRSTVLERRRAMSWCARDLSERPGPLRMSSAVRCATRCATSEYTSCRAAPPRLASPLLNAPD